MPRCDWTKNPSACKSSEKRIQVPVGRRPLRRALFTVSSATRQQSSTSGKLIFMLFDLKRFETKHSNGIWVQLFH